MNPMLRREARRAYREEVEDLIVNSTGTDHDTVIGVSASRVIELLDAIDALDVVASCAGTIPAMRAASRADDQFPDEPEVSSVLELVVDEEN